MQMEDSCIGLVKISTKYRVLVTLTFERPNYGYNYDYNYKPAIANSLTKSHWLFVKEFPIAGMSLKSRLFSEFSRFSRINNFATWKIFF